MQYASSFLPLLVILGLVISTRFHGYLLFHTSVEIFSILIALAIFLFSWNTRKLSKNYYFLFLGITYLSVGAIGFAHALSYKGMQIFQGFDANTPTQLWIGQRYLLAFSLLVAPVFIGRKLSEWVILLFYALIVSAIILSVFFFRNFPESFREGVGLTPFKVYSEYFISSLFVISIAVLAYFRNKFDRGVFMLLSLSLVFNIVSELLFTLYVGVYDYFNMLGHIGQLVSYYFIYKAIISVGLTKPFSLLFLELKEAEKRKDEFISIASHELKTPVATIKSYTQILNRNLKEGFNDKSQSYVFKLEAQVNRLIGLIDELLDVSKIQCGKLNLLKTRINLTQLVKEVVQDMQQAIRTHKIIVEGSEDNEIMADKRRVEQVLVNMISNAVKFSPKADKVLVKIISNRQSVSVGVTDFGIGINQGNLAHVFDRFYQANNKIRESNGGLGLGLYLSKQIIKRHKGEIWGSSEKGRGSTFTLRLPIN